MQILILSTNCQDDHCLSGTINILAFTYIKDWHYKSFLTRIAFLCLCVLPTCSVLSILKCSVNLVGMSPEDARRLPQDENLAGYSTSKNESICKKHRCKTLSSSLCSDWQKSNGQFLLWSSIIAKPRQGHCPGSVSLGTDQRSLVKIKIAGCSASRDQA